MRNSVDLNSADEETLVGLAKTGSEEAFGQLVMLKQSWLRNLFLRLSNDPELARDLSQQVFLSAWKGIRNLHSNNAFHSWLKRIAVNTWLNHVRVKAVMDTPISSPDLDIDQLTPINSEPLTAKIDLDRALAVLGVDERLCIVLSYNEGLSHGRIADITGFPLGTVKSHIRRGTQVLRKILAIYETKE